jgi:hypothetical protein
MGRSIICVRIRRFDPAAVLEKLRGKRLMFVGDSLQMGQWLSFVCLVNSAVHYTARSMERSTTLSVFTATVSTHATDRPTPALRWCAQ